MIDKTLFLIWAIWYFYKYGPSPILFNLYYFYDKCLIYYNKIIYPGYWDDEEDTELLLKEQTKEEQPKKTPKYEDKYLEDIRRISKEWIFTKNENDELPELIEKFYKGYLDIKVQKIEEIGNEIGELEKQISQDTTDVINFVVDQDGYELTETLEERNEIRRLKIEELKSEILTIKSSEDNINEIKKQSEKQARQYIINTRLEKLKSCYIIEKTPIGNVLMIYEKDRESFKYYSDCNIPYRYLEVVARKYVKLFGCRPIFVDMEEELSLFEEKWEKEQELKKIKEEEKKKKYEEAVKSNTQVEEKKGVFAKFKSYNKDAGGKISMAAPPKNSIPNKSVTENNENDKILLKERANRYTYEGKFANFNFLQKIDRKVFNKKLALSFADFKKMKK